uniref:Uncharacterized protein n=1 Tax=viral metagenome TaxID=1070528 RepID=A0A6C0E2X1_9ZZZZ
MQSEYKHKERTTKRNKLNEGDPIAQFKEKMNAVLLSIKDQDDFPKELKTINLEYLENCIDNIHYSNPEKSIHLNPVAFILGFYILKNKEINKEKFVSLNTVEDLMEENFISSIDVIRYARYFIMNNEFKNNTNEINESVNIEENEENEPKKMINEYDKEDEYDDDDKKDEYDDNEYLDEYLDEDMEGGIEESKGYEPDSLKKFK